MEDDDLQYGPLDLVPGWGTYRSAQRFVKNPSWGGAAEFILDGAGDLALLTGVGAGVKGALTAAKAGKVARNIYKVELLNSKLGRALRAAARTAKRERDATTSLTLMNAPQSKIIDRQRRANQATNVSRSLLLLWLNNRKRILDMYDNPTKGFNSLATLRDLYRTFGKGAYLTGGGLDVTGTAAGLTFNK